jgi:hypothetical protein
MDPFLTGEAVTTDPVRAADGHTYDRHALELYFNSLRALGLPIVSPATREPISAEMETVRNHSSNNGATIPVGSSSGNEVKSVFDMSRYFEWLDPCRDLLEKALDGWTPPCVIVLGSENSGKSSIFERLTLMSIFPRQEGFCTRLPIHARLRRSSKALPPELVIFNTITKKEEYRRVIPLHNGHIEVAEAMHRILKEGSGSNVVSGISLTHIIILHVHSPRVPTIDLIDLPGIVSGAVQGEPLDLSTLTRGLLDAHILQYGERAMYLCVCPATLSTNKDIAFGYLQTNGLEHKAIGVITMCDLKVKPVYNAQNKRVLQIDGQGIRDIITDDSPGPTPAATAGSFGTNGFVSASVPGCGGKSSIRLWPHGYVCVMNSPLYIDAEANKSAPVMSSVETLLRQNQCEIEFFAENNMQDLLDMQRAGANALISRLNTLYSQYLITTWLPKTIFLVSTKLNNMEIPIRAVGVPDYSQLHLQTHIATNSTQSSLSSSSSSSTNSEAAAMISAVRSDFSRRCCECVQQVFVTPKQTQMDSLIDETLRTYADANAPDTTNDTDTANNIGINPRGSMQGINILLSQLRTHVSASHVYEHGLLQYASIPYREVQTVIDSLANTLTQQMIPTCMDSFAEMWSEQTNSSFEHVMSNDVSDFKFGRLRGLIARVSSQFYPLLANIYAAAAAKSQQYVHDVVTIPSKYVTLRRCLSAAHNADNKHGGHMMLTINLESVVCEVTHLLMAVTGQTIVTTLKRTLETVVASVLCDNCAVSVESEHTLATRRQLNEEKLLLAKIHAQLLAVLDEQLALQPPQQHSQAPPPQPAAVNTMQHTAPQNNAIPTAPTVGITSNRNTDGVVITASGGGSGIVNATGPAPVIPVAQQHQRIIEQTMNSLATKQENDFEQAIQILRNFKRTLTAAQGPGQGTLLALTTAHKQALLDRAKLLREGMVTTMELDMLRKMENRATSASEISSAERQRFREFHQQQLALIIATTANFPRLAANSYEVYVTDSILPTLRRCRAYANMDNVAAIGRERNFETVFEAHFGVFVKSVGSSSAASGSKSWQGTADIINESCIGKPFNQWQHEAVYALSQSFAQAKNVALTDEKTISVLLDLFENRSVVVEGLGIFGKARSIVQRLSSRSASDHPKGDEVFIPHALGAWTRIIGCDEATLIELLKIGGNFNFNTAFKLNKARLHLNVELSDLSHLAFTAPPPTVALPPAPTPVVMPPPAVSTISSATSPVQSQQEGSTWNSSVAEASLKLTSPDSASIQQQSTAVPSTAAASAGQPSTSPATSPRSSSSDSGGPSSTSSGSGGDGKRVSFPDTAPQMKKTSSRVTLVDPK